MLVVSRRHLLRAAIGAVLLPVHARAKPKQLTLATGSREPMVSAPGQPGFAEEVARAALARMGIALTVVPLPVERALVNANAGIEDGDLIRVAGFEKDYPNLVQVPEPLLEQEFVALALRPDVQVRDWRDLDRYSVAHLTGMKVIERQLEGRPNVTTVRDADLLFGLLGHGRADVIVHNRAVALLAARRAGLALRVQEPALLRQPMYIYLHRRHEALAPKLAAAIAELRRDGTWQRLYDQILAPLEPAR
ncbi:MAG: transporter substrate-binding domain-containing protein [Burkholderiaceae bacterium]|nr:transporter substrate-binding domain-containing protein [Burkholderiaceae bacterium]